MILVGEFLIPRSAQVFMSIREKIESSRKIFTSSNSVNKRDIGIYPPLPRRARKGEILELVYYLTIYLLFICAKPKCGHNVASFSRETFLVFIVLRVTSKCWQISVDLSLFSCNFLSIPSTLLPFPSSEKPIFADFFYFTSRGFNFNLRKWLSGASCHLLVLDL